MQPKSGVQDIAVQFAEFCRSCDARLFQEAKLLSWCAAVLWLTVHRHVVLALSREGKQHGYCGWSSGSDDVQRPAVPTGHEVLVVLVQADDCRHYQRMHSVDLLRSRVVTLLHCNSACVLQSSAVPSVQRSGAFMAVCNHASQSTACVAAPACTRIFLPLEMSTMWMRFSPLMGWLMAEMRSCCMGRGRPHRPHTKPSDARSLRLSALSPQKWNSCESPKWYTGMMSALNTTCTEHA